MYFSFLFDVDIENAYGACNTFLQQHTTTPGVHYSSIIQLLYNISILPELSIGTFKWISVIQRFDYILELGCSMV